MHATAIEIAQYIEVGLWFVGRGEVVESRHEFFTISFPPQACVLGIALVGKERSVEKALVRVVKERAKLASDFARLLDCDPALARRISGAHLMHSEGCPRKSAKEIAIALRDGTL